MKNLFSALMFIVSINSFAASSAPAPSGAPASVDSTASQLSVAEKKNLLSEFKKARSNAEKAMKHQEQSQVKELQAAQSMQSKQWREREKKIRRDFFDAHLSGPERRQFVQEYLDKKSKYDQSLKDALIAKKKEWAEKNDAFKKQSSEQEIEFKKKVEDGIRPAAELWPKAL